MVVVCLVGVGVVVGGVVVGGVVEVVVGMGGGGVGVVEVKGVVGRVGEWWCVWSDCVGR